MAVDEWKTLTRDIEKLMAEDVRGSRNEIAEKAIEYVAEYSPVLKGTFVLNNIVSFGNPDYTANDTLQSKGSSFAFSDEDDKNVFSKGESVTKAKKKVASKGKVKTNSYQPIYVQNNLYYAYKVEEAGWQFTDAYEPYQKAFDRLEAETLWT